MKYTRIALALGIAACGFSLAACSNPLGVNPFTKMPPLEFPLASPDAVERLAAFGTPNWSGSEPHNGIDLVLSAGVSSTEIVAPAPGRVSKIKVAENSFSHPPGQLLITVSLAVSLDWEVDLVIEPGTLDPALKESQRQAVTVTVGQRVAAGDGIGRLLAGEQGYAHLHYMVRHRGEAVCAYQHSSDRAKDVFNTIAARSNTRPCY